MASQRIQSSDAPPAPGMRAIIHAFDWASSPLGPIGRWPASWRLALDLCLASPAPSALYLGPELRLLYNDAWAPVVGARHPAILGLPVEQVWRDVWDTVGPHFAHVRERDEGLSIEAEPLVLDGTNETWWTYTLTPLHDEAAAFCGILVQGTDVTKTVQAERRLSFQVQVADRLRGLTDPEAIQAAATTLLGEYLGASRVGYAEVDEAADTILVRSDWTLHARVPSLAGQSGAFSDFGEEARAFLRSGQVLAIEDVETFPSRDSQRRQSWENLGLRALITVPLVRDGAIRALLYVHELEPRRWTRAEAAMARDVAERTWASVERAQAESGLRASEDHYRHTVELHPQVTWTAAPDGQLCQVAPRWVEWTGHPGTGEGWMNGIHPDDRARSLEAWRHSVETGEPYDIEHRVVLRDGSVRWIRSRAFPRRGSDGAICLWYGATEDIDERRLAEEHQRLLINELNHRVKNTLASVQAIAFQTLKGDIGLGEARARFEARLLALSRAHNLLTEQNWGGAALERVVRDAVAHLAGERDRFSIEGEKVWLSPRAALALALALHELGTNAAKHGALATDEGRVAIAWRRQGDRLSLEWRESGGPAVQAPQRRGFGSRLIEQGLAADLGGSARLLFEPEGLRCVIEAGGDALEREGEARHG